MTDVQFFHGDCLVLPEMAPPDLIYMDPPFFTGRDFGEFSDQWDSFEAYLDWMEKRVRALHSVLDEHGSFYLHVDPIASHYLKVMVDRIFGRERFQREIVWRIGWISGFKSSARNWIRNHDVLLYYTKGAKFTFNKTFLPYAKDYVRRDGKPPTGRGVPLDDVWNGNKNDVLDSIQIKSFSREKTGYPTQKPVALLERIVTASSNPGDWVLDPMCGSGTTLVAAKTLGRNAYGIDLNPKALEIAMSRIRNP